MSDAAARPVGRTLAVLATEVDALAAEIENRELTADDLPFLEPGYLHLRSAAKALDAALLTSYAEIQQRLDELESAA